MSPHLSQALIYYLSVFWQPAGPALVISILWYINSKNKWWCLLSVILQGFATSYIVVVIKIDDFLICNKNIKKKVLFQHDVVSRFTRNEQFSQQQTFKTNKTLVLSHDYAFIFLILCVILSYLVKGKVLDPGWSFKKDKQKF